MRWSPLAYVYYTALVLLLWYTQACELLHQMQAKVYMCDASKTVPPNCDVFWSNNYLSFCILSEPPALPNVTYGVENVSSVPNVTYFQNGSITSTTNVTTFQNASMMASTTTEVSPTTMAPTTTTTTEVSPTTSLTSTTTTEVSPTTSLAPTTTAALTTSPVATTTTDGPTTTALTPAFTTTTTFFSSTTTPQSTTLSRNADRANKTTNVPVSFAAQMTSEEKKTPPRANHLAQSLPQSYCLS